MKSYLIISILLELLKQPKIKAGALAEKLEISTRTVYRYLNDIESAGVPTMTYTGKNGGIGLAPGYKLSNIYFTEEEKQLIMHSITLLTFNAEQDIVKRIVEKLK